jgi:FeS assembly SUF system regulator
VIRLSRITDYGIVLMAYLAEQAERADLDLAGEQGVSPVNAREAAEATRLPAPVVSKILKSLAREGLLLSHRGAKGGYSLARPPEEITVPEMVGALEGPIGLVDCAMHPGACPQESACHVREPWQRINRAVHDALSRITLADLVSPRSPAFVLPLASLGVDTTGIDSSGARGAPATPRLERKS